MIYVISGMSASGKDTLVDMAVKIANGELKKIPMVTTRPKRPNEKIGHEYSFITKDEMFEGGKEGKYAALRGYKVSSGDVWYYAVDISGVKVTDSINNDYIVISDMDGIRDLQLIFGSGNVCGIFLEANDEVRHQRALLRWGNPFTFDEKEFTERTKRDRSEYYENPNLFNNTIRYWLDGNGTAADTCQLFLQLFYYLRRGGAFNDSYNPRKG